MKRVIKCVIIYTISFVLLFIGEMMQIHSQYLKLINGEYSYITGIMKTMYNNWDLSYILFECITHSLLLSVVPVIIYLFAARSSLPSKYNGRISNSAASISP